MGTPNLLGSLKEEFTNEMTFEVDPKRKEGVCQEKVVRDKGE
jgi:hypothetical protein